MIPIELKEKQTLQKEVFKGKMLKEEKVHRLFEKLDLINNEMLREIILATSFAEYHITFYLAKLFSRSIRGKSFDKIEKKIFKHALQFFDASSKGDKNLVLELVPKLRLPRFVYEHLIEQFLSYAPAYQDYVHKISKVEGHKSCKDVEVYNSTLHKIRNIEKELRALRHHDIYSTFNSIQQDQEKYKKIRNRLAQPYLRIPFSVATHYKQDYDLFMIHFQEGYLGLIKAITFFRPSTKTNFGAYAKLWVRKQVIDSYQANHLIGFPANVWSNFAKIKNGLEENKSVEDLAKESGLSEKRVDDIINIVGHNKNILSLSMKTYDDLGERMGVANKDLVIGDFYEDPKIKENQKLEEHKTFLDHCLQGLTEKERKLFCYSCGAFEYIKSTAPFKDKVKEVLRQGLAQIACDSLTRHNI